MLTAKQNEYLLKAVELLHEADVMMQKGFPTGADEAEECYAIHDAIECAADDILDTIQRMNPEVDADE